MATHNTPKRSVRLLARLRSGLFIAAQALLLIFLAATGYAYLLIAAAVIQ